MSMNDDWSCCPICKVPLEDDVLVKLSHIKEHLFWLAVFEEKYGNLDTFLDRLKELKILRPKDYERMNLQFLLGMLES